MLAMLAMSLSEIVQIVAQFLECLFALLPCVIVHAFRGVALPHLLEKVFVLGSMSFQNQPADGFVCAGFISDLLSFGQSFLEFFLFTAL
jgi:hypothetical protein